MQIRVYYEDTDIGGVVYYANYLKFCERARSEIFFSQGLSPVIDGCHFVVRSIQASYHKSARFGDILSITNTLIEKKKVSIKLKQEIFRDDILIFDMIVELVFLDGDKMTKIPSELLELFYTKTQV